MPAHEEGRVPSPGPQQAVFGFDQRNLVRREGRAVKRHARFPIAAFDALSHGVNVALLVDFCKDLSGDMVLVGSSLGGYVAVAAASLLHARGVFVMAPALYMEGIPPLRAGGLDCPVTAVHGWRDEVVPFEHSVRFAQSYHAALHLLDSDHLLHNQIRVLQYLFEYFLIALDMPTIAQP